MDRESIPVGFGFALAMNQDAMKRFAEMSEQEQRGIVSRARQVSSKQEMQMLVKSLAAENAPRGE